MRSYLKNILTNTRKLFQPDNINKGNGNVINISKNYAEIKWNIIGDNNIVDIAGSTILKNILIYIRGNNNKITIEQNCFIAGGELWVEDDNCSLIIRQGTTIEQAHLAVTENFSILEIMEDCMLAKNIDIRTGDSHSIIDVETGVRINSAANVKLMPHVWVGDGAKILKGVTIGQCSIIATGAIVTKNIPPNSLAAGIPASVIKSGINWDRSRLIVNK